VRVAAGADVLVHEVYPDARTAPNATESAAWPSYMRDFHTSDVEVGQLAARIRPKLVILTHIIRRGASDDEMLAAVHRSFPGRAVVGHDLERY
jgi:ribonuclease BN (tRNA processing enzyme)